MGELKFVKPSKNKAFICAICANIDGKADGGWCALFKKEKMHGECLRGRARRDRMVKNENRTCGGKAS